MADVYMVYTDGACQGNPGPGGWAYRIVVPGQSLHSWGNGPSFRTTTNNRMELAAIHKALQAIPPGSFVKVHTDSKYCVHVFMDYYHRWEAAGWQTSTGQGVKNEEQIRAIRQLMDTMDAVTLKWVARNSLPLMYWCDEHAKRGVGLAIRSGVPINRLKWDEAHANRNRQREMNERRKRKCR